MKCSRCKSEDNVKNGIALSRQRYKCKACGYNFTIELKSTSKPEDTKRQALLMYLEGLCFHSIGRILQASHVSVMNWVRKYGNDTDIIRNDKPFRVMELDELHSYVGNKKTIDGFGLGLIETDENTLILLSAIEGRKQE